MTGTSISLWGQSYNLEEAWYTRKLISREKSCLSCLLGGLDIQSASVFTQLSLSGYWYRPESSVHVKSGTRSSSHKWTSRDKQNMARGPESRCCNIKNRVEGFFRNHDVQSRRWSRKYERKAFWEKGKFLKGLRTELVWDRTRPQTPGEERPNEARKV